MTTIKYVCLAFLASFGVLLFYGAFSLQQLAVAVAAISLIVLMGCCIQASYIEEEKAKFRKTLEPSCKKFVKIAFEQDEVLQRELLQNSRRYQSSFEAWKGLTEAFPERTEAIVRQLPAKDRSSLPGSELDKL